MNKSAIEWTDYTWNPISGCNKTCDYCYARRIAHRFSGSVAFPNGFEPTLHFKRLMEPCDLKTASRIFVCSMGELFMSNHGDWTSKVFDTIRFCDWHTFQLLTKEPQNLKAWSPFPKNCWVGVTATDDTSTKRAIDNLSKINATIKFISFEPLKSSCADSPYRLAKSLESAGINWVIIGLQTPASSKTDPQKEWLLDIMSACDRQRIPIFFKNNLKSLFPNGVSVLFCNSVTRTLRQEFPNV